MIEPVPQSVWRNWIHFLACGFGFGAIPWAPGTMGTIAAIPLFYLVANLSLWSYLILVVVLFTVGCWLCDITARDFGVHDHSGIVWDEIVGLLITLWGFPIAWSWVLIGFLLFRVFDIWKPFPINKLDEQLGGGVGIMVDYVLAGLYALVLGHLMLWVMRGTF